MRKLKTEEVQSLAHGCCGGSFSTGFVWGRGEAGARAKWGGRRRGGRGSTVRVEVRQVVR